jgi:hypothetical protein
MFGSLLLAGKKPKAKQQSLNFADTAFWFPRSITVDLIAYLYYQQPFIDSLLKKKISDLLYAFYI